MREDKLDKRLELDRQLCFPLYVASREVIRKYKPFLDEIGLTYTQYIVMLALWEDEKIEMRDLCRRLFLDSGTLTPLLNKLENNGLIERVHDEKDERRLIIHATAKGIGLKTEARKIPREVGRCLNLAPMEAAQLRRLLKKVIRAQK